VQTIPAPHPVPSEAVVHIVVETAGWQLWHALEGFAPFAATHVPPIEQALVQTPALQSCPVPHPDPSEALVHIDRETAGWQL
jgi:hypothetical protein